MAGLVVAVSRTGDPVPAGLVDRLAAAVAHRGPDGLTISAWDNVAVIHAALHATPEARAECQPLVNCDGTRYVADVRIDNRRELLGALDWSERPGPVTDLEMLAEVDHRWGVAGLDRVVGDFAFVSIDRAGRIRAARDHLGIKPLYHWCSSRWIVLASELRQIAAHPDSPSELDPLLIGQYLSGTVEEADLTVIRGVRRVPAAHVLEIDREPELRRYWTVPYDEPIELADHGAYVERGRELLTEAVRARLRTDGPIAAEVTGGLDSTSAAALARRLRGDAAVQTYSCVFPDTPGSDEQPFIDLAVEALGLDWEPIVSDPGRSPWVDADVEFSTDIPIPPDGPDHVALYRRAVERGCRVVLTGNGGDHWFEAGHLVLIGLLERGHPIQAWRLAADMSGAGIGPPLRRLTREAGINLRPSWVRRPMRSRAPWVIGTARAAAELDRQRIPGRLPRRFRSVVAQRRYEGEVGGYEAMTREIIDRLGARGGVELRHPYFDRRLMEFLCRLPVTVHHQVGRNRALQRDVLAEVLPEQLVERRSKASFGSLWLREIEQHLPDDLSTCGAVQRGWLDPVAAAEALDRTGRVVRARQGGANLTAMWGLVQVEALIRRLDG